MPRKIRWNTLNTCSAVFQLLKTSFECIYILVAGYSGAYLNVQWMLRVISSRRHLAIILQAICHVESLHTNHFFACRANVLAIKYSAAPFNTQFYNYCTFKWDTIEGAPPQTAAACDKRVTKGLHISTKVARWRTDLNGETKTNP